MMKETEMKRVPKLRFPEFTDDWEKRKLGDISEIKTGPFGSALHADDYVGDGVPIITTEHFKTGVLPQCKNGLPQVSDADYERLTAYILEDGDIVFSRVGSVDINALITPYQSNWLFSGRVLRVRPKANISSQFLHTRLETESIKTDIRARAVGQTMPSINTEILKITPVVLPPSIVEQKQIGLYFAHLDHLITLHQRKFKTLKKLKEGVMQKLFSQEVRFKADDGSDYPNWKTKKIGDVCTQIKETIDPMANPKKLFVEYSMPAFDNEMKPEVVYGNTMNSIRKVIGSPCVLINKLNVRKRRIWNIVNPEDNAVCSAEFVPLTSEVMNLSFVAYFALTDWFTRYLLECSTGSSNSQKRVTPDVILNIKMSVPCLAEQQKIVDCLSSLDHVIEKQKATLAAWEELKKGLLQQMFV